ncbi:hypothetical protein HYY74_04835 [Candidatus Woesearchaeota archaeon]|nr:hypothetical protein [Candidatus Woesearchaeota archaeon]
MRFTVAHTGRDGGQSLEGVAFEMPVGECHHEVGHYGIREGDAKRILERDDALLSHELARAGLDFSDYVWIPDWHELVMGIWVDREEPPLEMRFYPLSSYRVQAYRRGHRPFKVVQAGVIVFPVTLDERVVFGGVRAGADMAGTVAPIGGAVDYPLIRSGRHPIFASGRSECVEEVGYSLAEPEMLGHFLEPSYYHCRTFVLRGGVKANSGEVVELHSSALAAYQKQRRYSSHADAEGMLKLLNMPNTGAWEHSELILVPYDARHIQQARDELMPRLGPIALGSLEILLRHMP